MKIQPVTYTPTPWVVRDKDVIEPEDQKYWLKAFVRSDNRKEDAAFIVRAVNSHEEMLNTLRWIEQYTGSDSHIKAACQEVIAKAEGGK